MLLRAIDDMNTYTIPMTASELRVTENRCHEYYAHESKCSAYLGAIDAMSTIPMCTVATRTIIDDRDPIQENRCTSWWCHVTHADARVLARLQHCSNSHAMCIVNTPKICMINLQKIVKLEGKCELFQHFIFFTRKFVELHSFKTIFIDKLYFCI